MADRDRQTQPAKHGATRAGGLKTVTGPVRPGTAPAQPDETILSPLGQEQRQKCQWLPCPSVWS